MQQRKEVECMIEITIKADDDTSDVRMEMKGNPLWLAVPVTILLKALVAYLQKEGGMSELEAMIRIFLGLKDCIKSEGYSKEKLHRMVDFDLEVAAESMKH